MRLQDRISPLWRHPDFLKLWAGETVSLLGSEVTVLALPLLLTITLHATALQVALLNTAIWAPYLGVSLFAGWWIDRHRRRPLLIFADLGQAMLLGLIPVAVLFHFLRIEFVYVIAVLVGTLAVLFSLAYRAYIPSLLGRENLLDGNSKMQVSASIAQIGGPGLGGLLVQVFTAPIAILLDAVSFLFSATGLILIKKKEFISVSTDTRESIWRQIGAGLRLTFKNPYLRVFTLNAMTYNFSDQFILALFVVYATRELLIPPILLGTIMATASIGALLGALIADPLAKRLGMGPALISSNAIECLALLLIPLAGGPLALKVTLLICAFFFNGMGLACANVYFPSIRQATTPDGLLGRMSASYAWLILGVVPIGAALAGVLQQYIGIRATLFCGAIGILLSFAWLLRPHLLKLRSLSDVAPAEAEKDPQDLTPVDKSNVLQA